ncbi:MAG: hypothetical protein ACE5H4_15600, partial [Candidatus Thorarchaeota archaeon]
YTESTDIPTVDAYDPIYDGGIADVFIAILDQDSDADGIVDWYELRVLGTDPSLVDTDGDNFLDGYEVAFGTDATDPASHPNMPQAWYLAIESNATLLAQVKAWLEGNATELALVREVLNELGVTIGDTDYDGLDDLDEILHGTDIHNIDTDTDNLNDAFEVKIGTDPLVDDTDGDTFLDGVEVLAGTDPLDAASYPGSGGDPFEIWVVAVAGVGVAAIIIVAALVRRRS